MPKANTPRQAVTRYLAPFRAALGCIQHGTLITTDARQPVSDQVYALIVNDGEPLELRRNPSIAFGGGQLFRIVRDDTIADGPHRVHTVKYFYAFATDDGQEILNFQWTPEEGHLPGRKAFPHLHIGRGLLGGHAGVFPDTFHKLHVPTGRVSFESIIRFAIEELGVPHLRDDWRAVLDRGQHQFERERRA